MSSQGSVFDVPLFAPTCPRCKHFHKNWKGPLPEDGGKAKCARCKTIMFALGRVDEQYTLASEDSMPMETPLETGTDGDVTLTPIQLMLSIAVAIVRKLPFHNTLFSFFNIFARVRYEIYSRAPPDFKRV